MRFTPDILKFLKIPDERGDQCPSAKAQPKSSLSFGVITRTVARLSVPTPTGQAMWPQEEGALSWVSKRLRYLVVPDPPDGPYRVSFEGQAGEHYLFGGYAGGAVVPERFERAITL